MFLPADTYYTHLRPRVSTCFIQLSFVAHMTTMGYMTSNTVYHVTTDSAWESIKTHGLRPAIGERSADLGESIQRIYLFPSEEDMDSALWNWLGECFEDEEGDLHILAVDITGYEVEQDVEWEMCVLHDIPASRITHLRTA